MVVPISRENPSAFNAAWYMAQNPDLAKAAGYESIGGFGIDTPEEALTHYLTYGQAEGRIPNPALAAYDYTQGVPSGGVRDISVEPLTQWEKSGLSSLAGTGDMAAQQYQQGAGLMSQLAQQPTMNPLAQPAFEQMQQAIGQGTREFTQSDIDRFMNPYQQQVIDRLNQNLTEQGQRAMSKLQAQDVGRSAGSSSRAIQQGMLQRDLSNTMADKQANLLYQGFADALGNFGNERSRYMTGAGLYGNLGTAAQGVTALGTQTAQNLAQGLTGLGMQGIQNQIGAGSTVRGYNQALADRTAGALQGQIGYSGNQLTNLLNQINSIQGGSAVQNYTNPSTLGQVGAGLSGIADIYNTFNKPSLPWQAAGNINPLGGYY